MEKNWTPWSWKTQALQEISAVGFSDTVPVPVAQRAFAKLNTPLSIIMSSTPDNLRAISCRNQSLENLVITSPRSGELSSL
jgi:hypothetical protein